jgi:hypothetical protein
VRNRINAAARPTVVMLKGAVGTCDRITQLVSKYEELSALGDSEGIAGLKDTFLRGALSSCRDARTYAAKANNSFVDINHALDDFQIKINRRLNEISEAWEQAVEAANLKIETMDHFWDVMYELNQMNVILSLESAWVSMWNIPRATLDGQALAWRDIARTVSTCLGNVYGSLDMINILVGMDPARYKELISDEWENIIRDSNDVLSILASVGVNITMTRRRALEAAPGEPQPQQQHALISAPPKPKVVGDTAKVVKALLAPEDLESTMANAATKAKDFYAAMDDAHELPYLDGIVGYWDQDATVKQSLLVVVGNLNGDYNDNMGRQYSAVDGLRSFARTAPGYAQEISEAKGPQLQSTIASLRVAAETRMTYAQQAADDFHRASESLGHAMQQIKLNMEQIQQQIHDLDESIEELEEAEREIIQDMLANAIGIIFATGALLIALGVFGPVGAAIDAAAAAGAGLEVTKDMVNEGHGRDEAGGDCRADRGRQGGPAQPRVLVRRPQDGSAAL